MITYTVHEPPGRDDAGAPADRMDRAELLAFIKDGFDWSVFVLGPIALVAKGLFLAAAAYVGVLFIVILLLAALDADPGWISLAVLALSAIAAFEASEFHRGKLERKGWTALGAVNGRDRDDCERRFLESWLPREPMIRTRSARDQGGDGDVSPPGSGDGRTSRTEKGSFRQQIAGLRQRLAGGKLGGEARRDGPPPAGEPPRSAAPTSDGVFLRGASGSASGTSSS